MTDKSKSQINDDERVEANKGPKRKQMIILVVALTGILVFVFGSMMRLVNSKNTTREKTEEATIVNPIMDLSAQSLWQANAEDKVSVHDKYIASIQSDVKQAEDIEIKHESKIGEHEDKINQLIARIQELESQKMQVGDSDRDFDNRSRSGMLGEVQPHNSDSPKFRVIHVSAKKRKVPRTPATYVPSGSYVKAVLLGGIDVSVGVTSSADPKPVLIRLMGKGSLANGMYSKLKDCRIMGSAYGEISSERAHIRLDKMSCLQLGEYRDFPVSGYVVGIDGKAGIRGPVVMRDGAMVGRALLGGFVGGLSKSAANSLTFQSVSPEGSVSTVKGGSALGYAGAEGMSDGLSMYSKYQIKRAEQYQPIIEVGAGTHIDVVFKDGFYLDGFRASMPGQREAGEADFDQENGPIMTGQQ